MTTQASHSPRSELEDPLLRQLQDVRARLLARYRDRGGITEQQARDAVDRTTSRFANAPVRAFIPILVERIVTVELERQSSTATRHVRYEL
jgi:hypothetical protein